MQCKKSKNKISQGISYMQLNKNSSEEQHTCNVKIAKEGFYMALVTWIKETVGKGFHNDGAVCYVMHQKEDSTKCKPHAM